MRGDAPEPLIFTAWLREAVRAIYSDDLGAAFARYFDTRALALIRLLEGRANGPRLVRRPRDAGARELRRHAGRARSRAALADLERRYGKDRRKWRWDTAHYRLRRASPVRRVRRLAPLLQRQGAEPRRRLHAQPRQDRVRRGAAVRQPARLELPRHLRLRRSRPLALHPHHRPVGQPVLAVLPLVRRALGRRSSTSRSRPSGPTSTRSPSAPGSLPAVPPPYRPYSPSRAGRRAGVLDRTLLLAEAGTLMKPRAPEPSAGRRVTPANAWRYSVGVMPVQRLKTFPEEGRVLVADRAAHGLHRARAVLQHLPGAPTRTAFR